MTCKVLKVDHCGPIEVEGLRDVVAGLETINETLLGGINVSPSNEWEALLTSSVISALETADIEVTVGNTVSVTVDTSAGPVEVTGTVTVAEPLNVVVSNFPTEFAISNLADLEGLELTVTLDGEVVTVTPDPAFTQLFQDVIDEIADTIRTDYEFTGMCGYAADGSKLIPPVKQFIERRYTNAGVFLTESVVLSQFQTDGTITSYTLGAGEEIKTCTSSTDKELVKCPTVKTVVDASGLVGRDVTQEENDLIPAANTVRNILPWLPENINTPSFPTGVFTDAAPATALTGGYNDGAANSFRTRVFPLALEVPETCGGVVPDLEVETTIIVTGSHTVAGTGSDLFIYILSGPDNAPV